MNSHAHLTDQGTEPLGQYLREIARYPLLSADEEQQLARRVAAGDAAARQRMIESNLRLVVFIARGYARPGIDLLDLIQEGTIGLVTAVDRYDHGRGARFSSYAAWWIRRGILDALSAGARALRLPDSMRRRLGMIRSAELAVVASGRTPTMDAIAAEAGLTVDQVSEAQSAASTIVSLDAALADDGHLTALDLVADEAWDDPIDRLLDEERGRTLRLLDRLSERSREVIELRYGLRDGVARTVDAIGRELGVSGERVRQIELRAIMHLSADAEPGLREAA
jgi:RNA polymerase primary sigma factor